MGVKFFFVAAHAGRGVVCFLWIWCVCYVRTETSAKVGAPWLVKWSTAKEEKEPARQRKGVTE